MHLNAFNILQRHRLQAWARTATKYRGIHGPPIHQDLKVVVAVGQFDVVTALRRIAFK